MFTDDLRMALGMAHGDAKARNHEFLTVDHLLFGLLHDPRALEIVAACGGDVEGLRSDVRAYLDAVDGIQVVGDYEPIQTLGFRRVLNRAMLVVQAADKGLVAGDQVLLALFAEVDSQAVALLKQRGVRRPDVAAAVDGATAKRARAIPDLDGRDAARLPLGQALTEATEAAWNSARERRDWFLTVDHLLQALLTDPSATAVLAGCGADLALLRKRVGDHLDAAERAGGDGEHEPMPTLELQRAMYRAQQNARRRQRTRVLPGDLLIGLYPEPESCAVGLLRGQGIERVDVVRQADRDQGAKSDENKERD